MLFFYTHDATVGRPQTPGHVALRRQTSALEGVDVRVAITTKKNLSLHNPACANAVGRSNKPDCANLSFVTSPNDF